MMVILVNSTTLVNPLNMAISEPGYNILLLYHTLATIIGLLGNSLVLYGSVKYNSLSIDSVSIVLLESLAALDLVVVLFFMGSIWLSMVAGRWVLGTAGCFIYGLMGYTSSTTEMQVVTAISLYRLLSLLAPFTARSLNRRHALAVVAVLYGTNVAFHLGYHAVGAHYGYDARLGSCEISVTSGVIPSQTTVTYLLTGVVWWIVVPAVILPVSNVAILVVATLKSRKGMLPGRNALITVCCVTWVFVFSVTPVVVRIGIQTLDPFHPIPAWFHILSQEFLFLNSILNPVIYTATNRSFRAFLVRTLTGRRTGEMISFSENNRTRPFNNATQNTTAETAVNNPETAVNGVHANGNAAHEIIENSMAICSPDKANCPPLAKVSTNSEDMNGNIIVREDNVEPSEGSGDQPAERN